MKNSAMKRCSPRRVHTSTVKKSAATISSQCRLRNSSQVVFRLLSGAGSISCRFKISAIVLRASRVPDSTKRTESVGNPSPFSPPPSYFRAISLRRKASKVSGVTMGRLLQNLTSQDLRLGGQPTALVVVQTEAPTTELLAENPIFLAKVVNDLQLRLVHPSGNGDQHEPEGLQDRRHFLTHCRWWPRTVADSDRSSFQAIRGGQLGGLFAAQLHLSY